MSANQRGDEARGAAPESPLFALEPQQIRIGREIGKGAFSVVFAGELGKKRVAVKCQPKDADGRIPPFVLKEVQVLQRLQHPRLLEFIGACDNRKAQQVWILSEHADNGDVDQLLRAIRAGTAAHVGWRRLALIALDAAQGVAFLHDQRVIHRDIKSSNILLDEHFRAKLCDFGFAMDMKALAAAAAASSEAESQAVRRKSYCGTDAYMAPEMFLDEDYDESVDVFSFGVVLMEMLCCRVANQDGFLARLPQLKFRVNLSEFLDALPASCPPAFARLAEQCVSFEPSERPSAHVVVAALEALLTQKQLLETCEPVAPVELRPFTPLAKTDGEREPQMDDDDDGGNYSDEEEDDDDDYDDEEEDAHDTCGGRKRDDTLDLESDEADGHRTGGRLSAEAVAHPYEDDEVLEFCPSERQLPMPSPPHHSGVLLKRNRRGNRGWAAKRFVLDGDQLHYSTEAPASSAAEIKKRSASNASATSTDSLSTLALRDCRIWKTMEMPELCFNVINGNWKIVRELQAQTRDDLDTWMSLINQAIEFANVSSKTARSAGETSSAKSSAVLAKKKRGLSMTSLQVQPPASNDSIRGSSSSARTESSRSGKQPETRCPESAKAQNGDSRSKQDAQQENEDEGLAAHSTPGVASPEQEDETDEVYQWLKEMKLQRFTATFKAKGFSSIDFIRETGIETDDLNFLGIKDQPARKALMAAARVLRGED